MNGPSALILSFGLLAGLSGCMSGTVNVQSTSLKAGSGSSSPVGHDSEGASSGPSNSSTVPVSAKTLYFATLSSPGGHAATLSGLGFLSADAPSTSTPFGFLFSEPGESAPTVVYWRPVVVGGVEEIAWVQNSPGGTYELEILDPSSMHVDEQLSVPAAQSYSLFEDATTSRLAGIDFSGNLFVVNSSGTERIVNSGFGRGSQVRWVGGSGELAVTDPVAKLISIFPGSRSGIQAAKMTFQAEGFSASPSGRTYLLFASGATRGDAAGQLRLVDSATGKSRVLAAAVTTFNQPHWNGETQVAFVNTSSAGSGVDVLSLASGQVSVVYPVSSETSLAGSVCPSWVGGGLFFANLDPQGGSVIWRADGASSGVSEFAVPQDSEQQYGCPKDVSE